MRDLLSNPSWPHGKWNITYDSEKDKWVIKTRLGVFIAEVGPTLVANWMIAINNLYWTE